jgi:hypothetical protein
LTGSPGGSFVGASVRDYTFKGIVVNAFGVSSLARPRPSSPPLGETIFGSVDVLGRGLLGLLVERDERKQHLPIVSIDSEENSIRHTVLAESHSTRYFSTG